MTREIKKVGDEQIREADVLMLVDPDRADWQQLLWSAAIDDGSGNSAMMKIVEIAVDSRDRGQIEAARERVRRVKGNPGEP